MEYIKHFNHQSDKYLSFRPNYPDALFDYLAMLVSPNATVWDCGTGNGQAAFALANYFQSVFATDINFQQLEVAFTQSNIHYICSSAEKTPFSDQQFDLITIAQALHWFQFDSFYEEVRRVAKPSAIIAAWSYSLGSINEAVDTCIRHLYTDILGDDYWPKERRYIDEEYVTIPFPFKTLGVSEFTIEKRLNFYTLIGYLNTWSAVKEYQKLRHRNPIELIENELLAAWGNPKAELLMHWPIHLLLGQVNEGTR
jgi:ubiquinone/menaquinone biosynthesis C-methylase UbiE